MVQTFFFHSVRLAHSGGPDAVATADAAAANTAANGGCKAIPYHG